MLHARLYVKWKFSHYCNKKDKSSQKAASHHHRDGKTRFIPDAQAQCVGIELFAIQRLTIPFTTDTLNTTIVCNLHSVQHFVRLLR